MFSLLMLIIHCFKDLDTTQVTHHITNVTHVFTSEAPMPFTVINVTSEAPMPFTVINVTSEAPMPFTMINVTSEAPMPFTVINVFS